MVNEEKFWKADEYREWLKKELERAEKHGWEEYANMLKREIAEMKMLGLW